MNYRSSYHSAEVRLVELGTVVPIPATFSKDHLQECEEMA